MPRLSIIVPFVGSVEQLENTLVSVLEHRPAHCEVLVVLGRPYQDPYDLSGEVRFVETPHEATLVQLYNAGIEAAQADTLHLLQSGCEVSEGWAEVALRHFADPQVAAVIPWVVGPGDRQETISLGVSYGAEGRRRTCGGGKPLAAAMIEAAALAIGPTAEAGFYRASALRRVHGFDVALGDRLADVDLAMALREQGFRAVLEPMSRVSARLRPPESPGLVVGRRAEQLFRRYLPPHGRWRAQARHACSIASQAIAQGHRIGSWLQLLGHLAAWLSPPPQRCAALPATAPQLSSVPPVEPQPASPKQREAA